MQQGAKGLGRCTVQRDARVWVMVLHGRDESCPFPGSPRVSLGSFLFLSPKIEDPPQSL
jgi:hypothetical protein